MTLYELIFSKSVGQCLQNGPSSISDKGLDQLPYIFAHCPLPQSSKSDLNWIYGQSNQLGGAEDRTMVSARPRRISIIKQIPKQMQPIPPSSAFFVLLPSNRFRVFCHWLCNHSHFGNIILACIMFSSAMLAAEDPLNAGSERNQILNYFDYFFTAVFTIELVLKLISYGFIFHKGAFCRSAFNLLDLLVVCVSLISIFFRLVHVLNK
ncbi:voltage-dependent calcium channel type D subunit alpha-1-like [Phlebotomus papatasi]|uniref:voltage-dependent calcium channel type D subunit alpha-1-like n=1 Tax=Phlebotomus papatasi TaxID=29031 RepID=UPI00248389E2|nr:voltage-dependent calcium channel type D subunit alpha-1-like [Phlebotomus papatasi]